MIDTTNKQEGLSLSTLAFSMLLALSSMSAHATDYMYEVRLNGSDFRVDGDLESKGVRTYDSDTKTATYEFKAGDRLIQNGQYFPLYLIQLYSKDKIQQTAGAKTALEKQYLETEEIVFKNLDLSAAESVSSYSSGYGIYVSKDCPNITFSDSAVSVENNPNAGTAAGLNFATDNASEVTANDLTLNVKAVNSYGILSSNSSKSIVKGSKLTINSSGSETNYGVFLYSPVSQLNVDELIVNTSLNNDASAQTSDGADATGLFVGNGASAGFGKATIDIDQTGESINLLGHKHYIEGIVADNATVVSNETAVTIKAEALSTKKNTVTGVRISSGNLQTHNLQLNVNVKACDTNEGLETTGVRGLWVLGGTFKTLGQGAINVESDITNSIVYGINSKGQTTVGDADHRGQFDITVKNANRDNTWAMRVSEGNLNYYGGKIVSTGDGIFNESVGTVAINGDTDFQGVVGIGVKNLGAFNVTGATVTGLNKMFNSGTVSLDNAAMTVAAGQNTETGTMIVKNGAKLTFGADFDSKLGTYTAESGEMIFESDVASIQLGTIETADGGKLTVNGLNPDVQTVVTAKSLTNNGTLALTNAKYAGTTTSGAWELTNGTVEFETAGGDMTIGKVTGDAESSMHLANKGKDVTIAELAGDGLTVQIEDVASPVHVTTNRAANVHVLADAGNGNGYKDEETFAYAIAQSVVTGTGDMEKTVATTVGAAEGDIFGGFEAHFAEDGAVVLDSVTINRKLASYSTVQGLANYVWRHDMNDLTKRMGELRDTPQGIGVWGRLYGSQLEYGSALKAENNSVQIGVDNNVGYGWTVGSAFTYSDGDSSYANGSADSESWGFGVYGTWLADDGRFLDVIAKYSRIENDFSLSDPSRHVMAGDVTNNAFSVSAEIGWNAKLPNGVFIEPQAELTWGRVVGKTFSTSNDVTIKQDDFDSLIARGGVRAGWLLPDRLGRVYARVSLVHDFDGEASAVATKGIGEVSFKDDLGGNWVEYGLGANLNINDTTYTYFDFERTSGAEVEENWRWNIGIRHSF